MVKKAEIPAYIVDRALALAAERGWRRTSLREIAGAAGVSLIDLRRHYRSKGAILEAFFDPVLAIGNADDANVKIGQKRLALGSGHAE